MQRRNLDGRAGSSALILLCVAQFVLQLDFSIVNIALRTIQGELGFSESSLQWVVTGYALTFGSLLMLGGRIGDLLGRRRLLIAGLWVFGAASVVCGLAVDPLMLVAARAVQGIGAAMMAPTILAILTSIYSEGPPRTRALGIWTAANAAGGTAGIVLGGILTQYLGWRSIFLVNVPLIAVLIPVALQVLPKVAGDRTRKLDTVGAALVTIAIGSLIFGLTTGEERGFGSLTSVVAFTAFFVLIVAFIVVQTCVEAPMLPLGFLRDRVRGMSAAVMFLVGGVFASYAYFIALYLQRVLMFSEVRAALALVPAPTTLVIASTLVTRRLIGRFGVRVTMSIGLASLASGQLVLARLAMDSTYLQHVLPGLFLTAFGGALIFPAVTVGMTTDTAPKDQGLAGGLVPTAQQVGSAVVLAVLATVAASTATAHDGSLLGGYRAAYLVSAVAVTVTLAAVVAVRSGRYARPGINPG